MSFILSVCQYGYDLFFGIWAILSLSLEELLTLVPVDNVVTFASFLNPFSSTLTNITIAATFWNVMEPLVALAFSPALGISYLPLWACLCLCVPVYVVIGFVIKTIVQVLS